MYPNYLWLWNSSFSKLIFRETLWSICAIKKITHSVLLLIRAFEWILSFMHKSADKTLTPRQMPSFGKRSFSQWKVEFPLFVRHKVVFSLPWLLIWIILTMRFVIQKSVVPCDWNSCVMRNFALYYLNGERSSIRYKIYSSKEWPDQSGSGQSGRAKCKEPACGEFKGNSKIDFRTHPWCSVCFFWNGTAEVDTTRMSAKY